MNKKKNKNIEELMIEDIIKIFSFDTYVCSINGWVLEKFMMLKHGWDEAKFKEYSHIYLSNLSRITTDTQVKRKQTKINYK